MLTPSAVPKRTSPMSASLSCTRSARFSATHSADTVLGTGVLIFLVPRLLNYIVAAYLILVGILLILEATD